MAKKKVTKIKQTGITLTEPVQLDQTNQVEKEAPVQSDFMSKIKALEVLRGGPAVEVDDSKAFVSWEPSKLHLNFGDFGLSIIWGFGSHTENNFRFGRIFEFMSANSCEIYALGNWPPELHADVLKHFETEEFPIDYVSLKDFIWVLSAMQKYRDKHPLPEKVVIDGSTS